jgi:lysyl-tRNA synthetase class II
MSKINWNWSPKSTRGGRNKIQNIRVRITRTEKSVNHSITMSRDIYTEMGEPDSLCFGIGDAGVFVTTKKAGTMFNVVRKDGRAAPQVTSSTLTEAIFQKFGYDSDSSDVFELNCKLVDTNVWELTLKVENKYGFF